MSGSYPVAAPDQWQPGDTVFGMYEIQEKLGAGGMGVVHRVFHRGWGLVMAMKTPRPALLEGPSGVEDFVREAENWVRLGLHPHVTNCFYVRLLNGVPVVFTEYVDGGDLHGQVTSRELYRKSDGHPLERLLDYAIQFSRGLAYAHDMGLTHADVKNANVLLTKSGILKITDFGLSRGLAADPVVGPAGGAGPDTTGGRYTPAYASPEQAGGRLVTFRTDIWSWAVSVLELFVGHPPKWGPSARLSLDDYLLRGSSFEGCPPMPASLADLLRQCLAEAPEERPADFRVITERLIGVYEETCGLTYNRPSAEPADLRSDALNNQGVSLLDLGQFDLAAQAFEATLATDPGHVPARYNSALLWWRQGRMTDEQMLQTVQALDFGEGWERSFYTAGIHLERADSDALLVHGREARRLGAPPEAVRTLETDVPPTVARLNLSGQRVGPRCLALDAAGERLLTGQLPSTWQVWDLSHQRVLQQGTVPTRRLTAVAFSPDARFAYIGSDEGDIFVIEAASGSRIAQLKGHQGRVAALALEQAGSLTLSGGQDGTMRLWETVSGRSLRVFPHEGPVVAVASGMRGRRVAAGLEGGRLVVWDGNQGTRLWEIQGHGGAVTALSFSLEGDWLFSAGMDGVMRVWQADTGSHLTAVQGHRGSIQQAALDDVEGLVVSGGEDGTLRWWRWPLSQCWRTLSLKSGWVHSVALAGRTAAAATVDGMVAAWDVPHAYGLAPPKLSPPRRAEELITLQQGYQTLLQTVSTALTGQDLPSALEGLLQMRQTPGFERSAECLQLCDALFPFARRGALLGVWLHQSLQPHESAISRVACSFDAQVILSASRDGGVKAFDLGTLTVRMVWQMEQAVSGVAVFPTWAVVAAGTDAFGLDWGSGDKTPLSAGHRGPILGLAADRDGHSVLTAGQDGMARVWQPAEGATRWSEAGQGEAVALRADGGMWMWGSFGGPCRVWRAGQSQPAMLKSHQGVVHSVSLSLDGRRAASGGDDKLVHLWNVDGATVHKKLSGHTRPICDVALSLDGRIVVSGGKDRSLRVWDWQSGQVLWTASAHEETVTSVALSPDARWLVSGAADGSLKLWYLDWELLPWEDTDPPWAVKAAPWIEAFRARRPQWSRADVSELQRDLAYAGLSGATVEELEAALSHQGV